MGNFGFVLLGAVGFLATLIIVIIIFTTGGSPYSLEGVYADDNSGFRTQIFGENAEQVKKANEKIIISPWEDDKPSKSEESSNPSISESSKSSKPELGKSSKYGKLSKSGESGKASKSGEFDKPSKSDESGKIGRAHV